MSKEDKQHELRRAAGDGRIDDVKKYLNDDIVDVNWRDKWGRTALYSACMYDHRDVAELLLDHGADINATYYGCTPLMLVSSKGDASITKLLLDRGCNVNAISNCDGTALHFACRQGSTESVKELLAHGADTSIKKSNGMTPMDEAHHSNQQAVIDLLDSIKDVKSGMSELTASNTKVTECVGDSSKEESSSKVSIIIDRRCDELKRDIVSANDEKMKQVISDLEGKIETIKARSIDSQDQMSEINHSLSNLDGSSKVENRCEKLMSDRITLLEDKMGQSFEKMTNQLTTSTRDVVSANEEKMKKLTSDHEVQVRDINHRCEKLMSGRITLLEDKMNRSFEKITNQLTTTATTTFNAEVLAKRATRDMVSANEEKMKKLTSDHEAQVEKLQSDINHRCEMLVSDKISFLDDKIKFLEDKMGTSKAFDDMTNQLTISIAKVDKMDKAFERMTKKLTIIMAKVDEYTSNLSTIEGHLISIEAANDCKKRKRTSMAGEREAVSDGSPAPVDALEDERSHQDGGGCLEKESLKALNAFKRFCGRS